MSIKSKIKTFFFLDDEEYEEEEQRRYQEEVEEPARNFKQPVQHAPHIQPKSNNQNVVSLQSVQKASKVYLSEPRVYADSQDVADQIKNRRAVVVNLQRIEKDQGLRIIDFLSGTVYALGGDIQKIGSDIFLCTPDNVEVSGNISQILQEAEYENTRW
ncbi:cell division protein SepF [Bacillus sp. B1-b2]|uniref:cell division protein SepF n=1 Tax=Bacillus sp. B1-b2 TaxID=2653201 RepID=UPI001261E0CA|nr:cell division protein SepF [Bacillus sp. B1-b2]KAB7669249.1 cell division protein SepF [Bacillus sp. B1-b2]